MFDDTRGCSNTQNAMSIPVIKRGSKRPRIREETHRRAVVKKQPGGHGEWTLLLSLMCVKVYLYIYIYSYVGFKMFHVYEYVFCFLVVRLTIWDDDSTLRFCSDGCNHQVDRSIDRWIDG